MVWGSETGETHLQHIIAQIHCMRQTTYLLTILTVQLNRVIKTQFHINPIKTKLYKVGLYSHLLGVCILGGVCDNLYHRIPGRICSMKSIVKRSPWAISQLWMWRNHGIPIHGKWQALLQRNKYNSKFHKITTFPQVTFKS